MRQKVKGGVSNGDFGSLNKWHLAICISLLPMLFHENKISFSECYYHYQIVPRYFRTILSSTRPASSTSVISLLIQARGVRCGGAAAATFAVGRERECRWQRQRKARGPRGRMAFFPPTNASAATPAQCLYPSMSEKSFRGRESWLDIHQTLCIC